MWVVWMLQLKMDASRETNVKLEYLFNLVSSINMENLEHLGLSERIFVGTIEERVWFFLSITPGRSINRTTLADTLSASNFSEN